MGIGAVMLSLIDSSRVVLSILLLLLLLEVSRFSLGFLGVVAVPTFNIWHDDVRVLRVLMERKIAQDSTQMAHQMGAARIWCLCPHILPGHRSAIAAVFAQTFLKITFIAS